MNNNSTFQNGDEFNICSLDREIDNCLKCEELEDFEKVSGVNRGKGTEGLFFIGEAPSKAASSAGLAFYGSSINRLYQWFN